MLTNLNAAISSCPSSQRSDETSRPGPARHGPVGLLTDMELRFDSLEGLGQMVSPLHVTVFPTPVRGRPLVFFLFLFLFLIIILVIPFDLQASQPFLCYSLVLTMNLLCARI